MARNQTISDDFTYSNGALTGVDSGGWSIGLLMSDMEVLSNALILGATVTDFDVLYTGTSLTAAQYASCVMTTFTGSGAAPAIYTYINLRGSTSAYTTYEYAAAKGDGSFTSRIRKVVAGTKTLLTSENSTTWANGDKLLGEVDGSGNHVLERNDSVLLSTSNNDIASGSAGLYMWGDTGSSNDITLDTFRAGEVTSSGLVGPLVRGGRLLHGALVRGGVLVP